MACVNFLLPALFDRILCCLQATKVEREKKNTAIIDYLYSAIMMLHRIIETKDIFNYPI